MMIRGRLTWGKFKKAIDESDKVDDETLISYIDIGGFDPLEDEDDNMELTIEMSNNNLCVH